MRLLLVLLTVVFSINFVHAAKIELDRDDSEIGFSIIKFKIGAPVEGKFDTFYGQGEFDPKKKTLNKLAAHIFAPSIDTDEAKRDRHLRANDFFDVVNHPNITFASRGKVTVKNGAKLKGNLTMKGKTKPVTLTLSEVEVEDGEVEFMATGEINRLDYGVSWNHTLEKSQWKKVLGVLGKTVLDDKVTIKLKIEANVLED